MWVSKGSRATRRASSLFLALGGLERELLVNTVEGGGGEVLVARAGGGAASRGGGSGASLGRSGAGGADSAARLRLERGVDDGSLALVGEASVLDVPDLGAKRRDELLVVTGVREMSAWLVL